MSIEMMILSAGLLLLGAALSVNAASRIGMPTLLFFVVLGMIAGSEGLGQINFDNPLIARNIGTFALAIILFSGGLNTSWPSVRKVLLPGALLSTSGVLLTTLFLAAFIKLVLASYTEFDIGLPGLSWLEALLLAAIVSSTDAAAVFSVYRSSRNQPRRELRALLEFESGSNDPLAVLLTLTLLQLFSNGEQLDLLYLLKYISAQMVIGVLLGILVGFLGSRIIKGNRLAADSLYAIFVLSLGLISFGLAELLGGNGFLSIYLSGIMLGSNNSFESKKVASFYDGIVWLVEILLFVMLGLLVFPSKLLPVMAVSLVLAIFLLLIARPLAVLLCLLPLRFPLARIAYISWGGMRGSVPIVLATFPASMGINNSEQIFHEVFFIVLCSLIIQGMTLQPVTRLLGLLENPDEG